MKIKWEPQYEPLNAPMPTDEEMRALYAVWKRVLDANWTPKKVKTWGFDIVNPETREFDLFSYTNDGMPVVFIFRGAESIERISGLDYAYDPHRYMAETAQFLVEWMRPSDISPKLRPRLEALGAPKKSGKWPLFFSVRPGFIAGPFTSRDARFLTVALEQFLEIAPRLAEEETEEIGAELVLLPPDKKGEPWQIISADELPPIVLPERKVRVPKKLSRRIRALPPAPEALTVYLLWSGAPMKQRYNHLAYGYGLLVVEPLLQSFVEIEPMTPERLLDDVYERVPRMVADILLRFGKRPSALHTAQKEIFDVLEPMEAAWNVRVTFGDPPPIMKKLEAAWEEGVEKLIMDLL